MNVIRRLRPAETEAPTDTRSPELIAAEARLAETRRQRSEKAEAMRAMMAEFDGEPPASVYRLLVAEHAALDAAVRAIRAELAPLREAEAAKVTLPRSPARQAADAVAKPAALVAIEERITILKAKKRAAEARIIALGRSAGTRTEAATLREAIANHDKLLRRLADDAETLRFHDAGAVAEGLAPLRQDAGRRLAAALAEVERALVDLQAVDDAGIRRRVEPMLPPLPADPFLIRAAAFARRAAR